MNDNNLATLTNYNSTYADPLWRELNAGFWEKLKLKIMKFIGGIKESDK